jgi:AcrR family transcriptional regulator
MIQRASYEHSLITSSSLVRHVRETGAIGGRGAVTLARAVPISSASPTEAHEDRRVRRTRRLLAAALVELARERPFASITARDLTDRAEIGYATFFRHYGSPTDLLRSVVDDLLDELLVLLPPLAGSDPQRAGTLVFQHASEHADLYRLLLRTDRSLDLLSGPIQVGMQSLEAAYDPKPGSAVPFAIAAHDFIRSFITLIEWWLEHDLPYEPERMGEIYRELIMQPFEAVACRKDPMERAKTTAKRA